LNSRHSSWFISHIYLNHFFWILRFPSPWKGAQVMTLQNPVRIQICSKFTSDKPLVPDAKFIRESYFQNNSKARDSSVGTATRLRAGRSGFKGSSPGGAENLSLHHRIQNGSGVHSPSYAIGTRALFLGAKRPGREADHSPPSSAEVKECVEL
jgi:hypothetical protein